MVDRIKGAREIKSEFVAYDKELVDRINKTMLGPGKTQSLPSHESISVDGMVGRYEQIGKEIGKLTDEKNIAYGDSVLQSHRILEILYPNGVGIDQYSDMLCLVRMIDKQCRIANRKDAFGENPWKDIAGYAILMSKDGMSE